MELRRYQEQSLETLVFRSIPELPEKFWAKRKPGSGGQRQTYVDYAYCLDLVAVTFFFSGSTGACCPAAEGVGLWGNALTFGGKEERGGCHGETKTPAHFALCHP